MSTTLKIAVIGCGRILDAHLNGYKALWDRGLQDFRLVALCARCEADALRYRQRGAGPTPRPPLYGLVADPMVAPHLYVSDIHEDVLPTVYTDWRAMLDDPDLELDGVVILTPVSSHHELALAALERGLHVMVEKPMAITVEAATRMVEAAAKAKRQLVVAESARFHPLWRMSAWCIQQGLLGQIQLVHQAVLGTLWSPSRVLAETPWRHAKLTAGAGVSVDFGVHVLHLLETLCGPLREVAALAPCLEPKRTLVDSEGRPIDELDCEVDDTFLANLRFTGGAVGQVAFSAALHGEHFSHGPALYGTRGSLRAGRMVLDGVGELAVAEAFSTGADEATRERLLPHAVVDPFAGETLSWLTAMQTGQASEVDGTVGLHDLAMAYALVESAELGGVPIAVAEVENGEIATYQKPLNQHFGLL